MSKIAFFAAIACAVSAQSSIVAVNPFFMNETVTRIGSKGDTATYSHSCDGFTPAAELLGPILTSDTSDSPAEITPAPQVRRRQEEDTPSDESGLDPLDPDLFCYPYSIVEGPQTFEIHMTGTTVGILTVDFNCAWKGEITKADLSCTGAYDGAMFGETRSTETTVIAATDAAELQLIHTMAVVSGTGPSGGAGTGAGKPQQTGAGNGTPGNGTQEVQDGEGAATALSMSKTLLASVLGATGILAASMAL